MSTESNDVILRTRLVRHLNGVVEGLELGTDSFLERGDTQQLRQVFFQKLSEGELGQSKLFVPRTQFWIAHAVMHWLRQNVGSTEIILFHCFDNQTGAIRTTIDTVAAHFVELWDVLREDLFFTNSDVSQAVILEVNHFQWNKKSVSDGIFEMTLWGIEPTLDLDTMKGSSIRNLGTLPSFE